MSKLTLNLIDEALRHGPLELLHEAGYRKTRFTFRLQGTDAVKVLSVQSSWGNVGRSGRFTLNLDLYFPEIERRLKQNPVTTTPTNGMCTLNLRIGELLPLKSDHWWSVSERTNLERLGKDLTWALGRHALPWLDRLDTHEASLKECVHRGRFRLAMIFALHLGRRAQAQHLAEMLLKDANCREVAEEWSRSVLQEGLKVTRKMKAQVTRLPTRKEFNQRVVEKLDGLRKGKPRRCPLPYCRTHPCG